MHIQLSSLIGWIASNMNTVAETAAWLIAGSSIIVRFAPQLPDNHIFKGVLRILGKIALNRNNPK